MALQSNSSMKSLLDSGSPFVVTTGTQQPQQKSPSCALVTCPTLEELQWATLSLSLKQLSPTLALLTVSSLPEVGGGGERWPRGREGNPLGSDAGDEEGQHRVPGGNRFKGFSVSTIKGGKNGSKPNAS